MISMVPYCSIHNLPTMMLWTQQLTLDHVYVSFHLSTHRSYQYGFTGKDFSILFRLTLGPPESPAESPPESQSFFSFFFCCNSHHRVPSRRIIPSGRILGLICHRTSFLTGSLRIFPDPSGILNREARQRFGQVNRNRSRWMDNGTITAITTGAGGILSLSLSFSIQDRSVLPGKFHGERSFGLDLDTLAPEFDFRVDGSMETEGRRLGVERRNRRVVTHLLANDPTSSNHNKINTQTSRKKSHLHYINGNNPDDPINPSIPSFLPSPSQKTRSTGILKSTHKSN